MPRFDYQRMVHDALRQVVRFALEEIAAEGTDGARAFYIGFWTRAPGVELPPFLRDLYPETMTIVLQHQFWNLEVGPESFSVSLAFNGTRHRLRVPYQAIESFADPAAQFGLRFEVEGGEEGAAEPEAAEATQGEETGQGEESPARRAGSVVRLDEFRRR